MEKFTKFLKAKGFSILGKLKGDASTREFIRVKKGRETFVVMRFEEEDISKQIKVFRSLSSLLPLSRIIEVFYPINSLLMEDAGDLSLEEFVKRGEDWEPIYRGLMGMILTLQKYSPSILPEGHPVKERKLDRERLGWELDFTYDNFIIPYGLEIVKKEWRKTAEKILDFIEYKLKPCHRDFHSRNIFIKGKRIMILDYQDSMMGPVSYDYASLLRDNYIYLNYRKRTALEDRLWSFMEKAQYTAVSFQRHLKALGTFGFQTKERGNKYFEKYIPTTLAYMKEEIKEMPYILKDLSLFIERKIIHRINF